MAMAHSLYTGVTGLTSTQTRLDSIGHNLSNVNTLGYRRREHLTESLFSQTLRAEVQGEAPRGAVSPMRIGQGTGTGANQPVFTQGSLNSTGRATDMAIEGHGFFVLRDVGGTVDRYTRDGSFHLHAPAMGESEAGTVVPKRLLASDGRQVQGYLADETGAIPADAELTGLTIAMGQPVDGTATTRAELAGNLDAHNGVVDPHTIDTGTDPSWTTDNGSTIRVGHVETSGALFEAGAAATDSTDLQALQYRNEDGSVVDLFPLLQDGDEVGISFRRGGNRVTSTFVYHARGETYTEDADGDGTAEVSRAGSGTTLGELATWLCGGLGDDGSAATERLDGGALGTIRTREMTAADDGVDLAAEHGGAYFRTLDGSDTGLSIASNLGAENAVTDLVFSHGGTVRDDLFGRDPAYGGLDTGGSDASLLRIYDQAGDPRDLRIRFSLLGRGTGTSTWRWIAEGPDTTAEAADGTPNRVYGTGVTHFGHVEETTPGGETVNVPQLLAAVQNTPRSLGEDVGTLQFDPAGLTQLNAPHDVAIAEQNGYPPGHMDNFSVTPDGLIHAGYSNGQVETVGQVAVAMFPNPRGLLAEGDSLMADGAVSGEVEYSVPGGLNPAFGRVRGRTLEESNVRVDQEMTELITTQRSYQANARIITTTDEMLTELLRLKR
jgi:flagellar hook protein FlgE